MTGLYEGQSIGDMLLKPKARLAVCVASAPPSSASLTTTCMRALACQSAKAKGGKGGAAKAGGGVAKHGGGGGGVSRRVRVARYLGLLPPAGNGLQPLPILPPA